MSLRIAFMGTPEFAVPTLIEIVGRGHEVAAVYTRPAKPAGRGLKVIQSPVQREAQRFGLKVHTPRSLRFLQEEEMARALRADAAVVVAYGQILPSAVLSCFGHGAFNLHASLLPRWRGAAPVQRAIMAGDSETGVMVMKMEEGIDTGPIAMAERVPIGPDATAGDLHHQLATLGADLMLRALAALERHSLMLTPQPQEGVTYAPRIGKDESRIVWTQPWHVVHNQIRGLSPHPGGWFEWDDGRARHRIKVLRSTRGLASGPPGTVLDHDLTVACGEGAVRMLELQRAGRRIMTAEEFARGTAVRPGTRFE